LTPPSSDLVHHHLAQLGLRRAVRVAWLELDGDVQAAVAGAARNADAPPERCRWVASAAKAACVCASGSAGAWSGQAASGAHLPVAAAEGELDNVTDVYVGRIS